MPYTEKITVFFPESHIKRIHMLCGQNVQFCNLKCGGKGKGKTVPLQAWSGPDGSRKLRFPHFLTTAQNGGKVVSLTYRPPLPPGNIPGTYFC
jgi:hypothetical protein